MRSPAQLHARQFSWSRVVLPFLVAFAATPSLATVQDTASALLLPTILASIRTKSPDYAKEKDQVFANSFDWHSSVHAHWAALSIARHTGDRLTTESVLARLTEKSLKRVRQRLNKEPTYELPYGQAWLLMLLSELRNYPIGKTDLVNELQVETENRVINYLLKTGFPDRPKRFCGGDHDGWLFIYLLLRKSHPSSSAIFDLMGVDALFEKGPCRGAQINVNTFVSVQALHDLLGGKSGPLPKWELAKGPILNLEDAHKFGRLITLAWPLAAAAANPANAKARETYETFMAELLRHRDYWAGNFVSAHWIPQFLWFGIWLSLGEP